jgi:hypothetical protein
MSKKKLMPLKNCKNCIFYCEGIENAVCTQTNYILDFGFDGEIPLNCPLEEFNCPLEGEIYKHFEDRFSNLLDSFHELNKEYWALKSKEWPKCFHEWLDGVEISGDDDMLNFHGIKPIYDLPIPFAIFLNKEFGFDNIYFDDELNTISVSKSDD